MKRFEPRKAGIEMELDLSELERRAKAATPGKWTWKQVGSFNTPGCAIFWPDTSKGGVHYRRLDSGGGMLEADANFIAAANPAAVLELVRRLRAASHALEYARTVIGDDRQALIDCHRNPATGLVDDELGAEALATYDRVLKAIDCALQPPKNGA